MKLRISLLGSFLPLLLLPVARSQSTTAPIAAASASTAVPQLVSYSGIASLAGGDATLNYQAGERSITFLIYKDESGGEPLWTETQAVVMDAAGRFRVQLGATSPSGLPAGLFANGEARWLEVQAAGQPPQPRTLLASVPYALKADDAATLGGLPASAFALARASVASAAGEAGAEAVSPVTTTGGTAGVVPEFSGTSTIVDSPITIVGTNVGIGMSSPTAALQVNGATKIDGAATVNGTMLMNGDLVMPPAGPPAVATIPVNSQIFKFYTSAFNSATGSAVQPRLEWRAEVVGNNTPAPSATLNLLSSSNAQMPGETGFHFNANGTLNFAPGQTFPGTGTGTITGVNAGTGLTGGGQSGNVKLGVNTAQVPLLAANNSFVGNQIVTGSLNVTGAAAADVMDADTAFNLEGNPFGYGSIIAGSVFLGWSGPGPASRALQSGYDAFNTAIGSKALLSNDQGGGNSAVGFGALMNNTEGGSNNAFGVSALKANVLGSSNSALGADSLSANTNGGGNTAVGNGAMSGNTTGSDNTAEGLAALQSNQTGSGNVGIGFEALWNGSGDNNIGIGYFAGETGTPGSGIYLSGSLNTAIGSYTRFGSPSIANATAIGAQAEVLESNTLILGCTEGTNGCTHSVNVGIGTTKPDSLLTVNGTADKPGGGSWGTYSDGRLKTVHGSFEPGLDQVMQLRPIRYRYKPENALGIRDSDEHIGVVAQEVRHVIPEAVTENGKGYLLVNNDPILWSMVNAIQQQQRQIAAQKKLIVQQSRALQNLSVEVRATRRALRQVKSQGESAQTLIALK